jgi:iron complex transport system substrate-binding protein
VADATGIPDRAAAVVTALRRRIETVTAKAGEVAARPRVLALEWLDPLFMAGHWVPEMVGLAGGRDILGVEGRPSAEIAWSRVIEGDPEVIVLMPCGFTLEQTVNESARLQFVEEWVRRTSGGAPKVYAVNGSAYFNRPGPRIVDGLEILLEIIQPELAPARWEGTAWQRLA